VPGISYFWWFEASQPELNFRIDPNSIRKAGKYIVFRERMKGVQSLPLFWLRSVVLIATIALKLRIIAASVSRSFGNNGQGVRSTGP
jgi:hypothetical protein